MNTILVTGGAGFIGSHTLIKLACSGYNLVVLDNLCNSTRSVIKTTSLISNSFFNFYHGDIRDNDMLEKIFLNHKIDTIVHFAGLKSVPESEKFPLLYYDNNVFGTINLLKYASKFEVKKFIFSSSATVYGNPSTDCYKEDLPLLPANTYGETKAMIEKILIDLYNSNKKKLSVAILRYFNPVGAHNSGLIGENPKGLPNNLMPYIAQVALGNLPSLPVYGNDYSTPDGTGMRDYIHVDDLARGHLLALQYISKKPQLLIVNLGTGKPYSVLEMIKCFEYVSGKKIPFHFLKKRTGDLPKYYADPNLAKKLLGWTAEYNLQKMCEDAWRFQLQNKKINFFFR